MKKLIIISILITFFIPLSKCQTPDNSNNDGLIHILLGNPSNAEKTNTSNYLLLRPQYSLSYNCENGTPNWVSWHLNKTYKGDAERQNNFSSDYDLPSTCYIVKPTDYRGMGFDRGHMCPSEDRDLTIDDNSSTFLMTNIIPQSPKNNRGIWKEFESYCRDLIYKGNELYIISGPTGKGGTGINGYMTTFPNGNIIVPSFIWKIVLILPNGENDIQRCNKNTRVIAILTPNSEEVQSKWYNYKVKVRDLETITGFNFFNNLPIDVQNEIETKIDNIVN